MEQIVIRSPEEQKLLKQLEGKNDADGLRLKRYLAMPDLSRTPGSPINEVVQRILALDEFRDFAVVEVPEIVPADVSFDLFDFPEDHPARSPSDTYFLTKSALLRTHTTVSWYYYLNSPEAKERIRKNEPMGVLTYGKV